MQVQISGGVVIVLTKPDGTEVTLFNDTARNTLAVSRAVVGYYPTATKIIVRTRVDIVDKFGKASVDDSMFITVTKATALQFSYDGIAGRILGDEAQMYCLGDDFLIPLYISDKLSTQTHTELANC
jgi:hypothetical protein